MKIAAKITMARRKFANGPATTMAARLRTGWNMKLCVRSFGVHIGQTSPIGRARGVLVAKKFHIAAKGNRSDFPARAVAIVESEEFGPKTDRESQDAHPAPAGDEKMAELMEKDHKA